MAEDAITGTVVATRSAALGATFRAAREVADISVRQLAEEAGISHSTLSRWERGERHIAEDTYQQLRSLLVAHLEGTDAA